MTHIRLIMMVVLISLLIPLSAEPLRYLTATEWEQLQKEMENLLEESISEAVRITKTKEQKKQRIIIFCAAGVSAITFIGGFFVGLRVR